MLIRLFIALQQLLCIIWFINIVCLHCFLSMLLGLFTGLHFWLALGLVLMNFIFLNIIVYLFSFLGSDRRRFVQTHAFLLFLLCILPDFVAFNGRQLCLRYFNMMILRLLFFWDTWVIIDFGLCHLALSFLALILYIVLVLILTLSILPLGD